MSQLPPVRCVFMDGPAKATGANALIAMVLPMQHPHFRQLTIIWADLATLATVCECVANNLNQASPVALCNPGVGTGPVAGVDNSSVPASQCIAFGIITSAPTKALVSSSPTKAPVTTSPTKAPVTMAPQTALPTVIQGGNPGICAGSICQNHAECDAHGCNDSFHCVNGKCMKLCPESTCSSKADCAANGCDDSFHCVNMKCMKLDSKSSKGTKATKGSSAKSIKSSKLF
eukprot:scaffold172841_cov27-Cyclotella_meneghiniana.AAC.1